jgi:hypothetical protein
MEALLDDRRPDRRERMDLIRGALDAWVHPLAPSFAPAMTALVGGGLWTVVAAGVLVQPVPPDWPGYLAEAVPFALIAAMCLLVAVAACLLRAGEAATRSVRLATVFVAVGYLAWIGLLGAALLGMAGGPPLAAAQSLAMLGTVATGLILVRAGDEPIGVLLLLAALAMLMPWTLAWLGFGTAWTAIGIALFLDRAARIGRPGAITGLERS